MSKEKLIQIVNDIDTASEISYAILAEHCENIEDKRIPYIMLGVMQQLEKIKASAQAINKAIEEA